MQSVTLIHAPSDNHKTLGTSSRSSYRHLSDQIRESAKGPFSINQLSVLDLLERGSEII